MLNRAFIVLQLCVIASYSLASDELPAIEIQSTVFENQSADDFAQSVTIINQQELKQKKASSIGETVKDELGVTSTYFSPGSSRPIIRGLGSNRVRVLENGIDTLDVSSVSDDHAVSIEPYFAEQIEVLRGPATLRYGPGAIGGVVNVINKRLPKSLDVSPIEVNALIEHATVSDANTSAVELNGAHGAVAWHLDGLKRDTNDYDIDGFANEAEPENKGRLSNSDVHTDNIGFGSSYITDQAMLGFSLSKLDSDYGIPGAEEGDIRIDVKQYRYDGQFEIYQPSSAIDSISLRTSFNNYRHFEIEEDGEIATRFDNEELESRLEILNTSKDDRKNAFGVQYNHREFSAEGEEAFIQPVDENRYGVFAITNFNAGSWNLEAGGRFDRSEYDPDMADDNNFSVYSLSVGAVRTLANDMKFTVNAARSERAPQDVALYANGPHLATLTFERGDEGIDKEASYNLEIGLGRNNNHSSWQVNTFYNYISDYIYLSLVDNNNDGVADRVDEEGMFELDGELLLGNYANEDAEFYGIEAEASIRAFESESIAVDARVFGDYVRAKFNDNSAGNIPRVTPSRIGVGVETTYNRWNANFDVTQIFDQTKSAQLETDTDGFLMFNASLSRNIYVGNTDANVYLKAENLLDEDARVHTSFQKDRVTLPGRNLVFGLSLVY